MLTPGKSILAEPLKETPPIVLAVCKVVAVAALPVMLPEIVELNVLVPAIVCVPVVTRPAIDAVAAGITALVPVEDVTVPCVVADV